MTRSRGDSLSPALVERFSQRDLRRRLGTALPLITLDAEGHPHPMVVSYLEVRAYDSGTLGLVIHARSGSARNLRDRHVATLLVIEPDVTVYLKMRVVDGPLDVPGGDGMGLAYFLLQVEQVIEDAPAGWEAGMKISSALGYAPAPTLDEPWARVTLAALAAPRARA